MILGPPLDQSRFYAGDYIRFNFVIEMNIIDFDARVSISSIDGVFPPEAFAAALKNQIWESVFILFINNSGRTKDDEL